MHKQSVVFSNFLQTPAKAELASFKVAYRIAKCKKLHTIVKELVLPAALDLVSTIIGESAAQKLKAFPLSNNTISRRIDKITDDVNDHLVAKMRGNEFSLQLDEATTSTSNKDAYLICYVALSITTTISLKICSFANLFKQIVERMNCLQYGTIFFRKIISSKNIPLVYALMVPDLCLASLASCER